MSNKLYTQKIEIEQEPSRAKKIAVKVGLGAAGIGLAVGAGIGLSEMTTNGNATYRDTTALEKSILGVKSELSPNTYYPESSKGIVDLEVHAIDISSSKSDK